MSLTALTVSKDIFFIRRLSMFLNSWLDRNKILRDQFWNRWGMLGNILEKERERLLWEKRTRLRHIRYNFKHFGIHLGYSSDKLRRDKR